MVQLVEALRYEPEVCGFDSRWCHWPNLSGRTIALGSTQPLNRKEYRGYFLGGKGGRCVGLTIFPYSCAHYFEIWNPHLPEHSELVRTRTRSPSHTPTWPQSIHTYVLPLPLFLSMVLYFVFHCGTYYMFYVPLNLNSPIHTYSVLFTVFCNLPLLL